MERNQGTARRQVSEFTIVDPNVRDIITNALKSNGYDIELKPIIQEGSHFYIGDEFKVFRKE
ncbi:MAG: hypothetical protein AB2417_02620 [Clostridiaceae bacterium]